MAKRTRVVVLVALAGIAALLFLLLRAGGGGQRVTAAAVADTGAATAPAREPATSSAARTSAAPGKDPRGAGDPRAPIIDKIIVEKPEVCEGEENLITIEAHSPDGNDAGLRYLVHGTAGRSVPLRTRDNVEDPDAPPRSVLVVSDNGSTTSAPIPPYEIKRCAASARLRVRHFLLPNSTAEYRFEAKMIAGVSPGQPRPAKFELADFTPVRFEWDFGDGQQTTTREPYIEHSYELRDQRTFYTYHLVKVTAFDERGRVVVGRDALEIMNPAYEELTQKKLVKLMSKNTPRFPEVKDGKVQQMVHIWHFHRDPVPVDQVIAYFHDRHGKELGQGSVKPVELLGTNLVPPGLGITIRVTLEVDKHPDVGFITYDLHGTSSDGLHAMGSFSVMRPPDAPTRERNLPVTDGLQAAKIKRAMELLGRSTVTDEDLWTLERQGSFAGLEPLPVPPVDDGPPSWLPRPPSSDGEPWSPTDDPGPHAPDEE